MMKTNSTTTLTESDVKHIAKLANLSVDENEIEKFKQQLSAVLDYIGIINEVDTSKVEATTQVTNLENIFRQDSPIPSLSQEKALLNAPKKHKGFFQTDTVLEQ